MSHEARADEAAIMQKLDALTHTVQSQQNQLNQLQNNVADKDQQISDLKKELAKQKKSQAAQTENTPSAQPATIPAPEAPAPNKKKTIAGMIPSQPVGEAPPDQEKPPEVSLLANQGGVLTPYGTVVVEPFIDYSRSSVNDFTFEGVQVVPAFLIGDISAERVARDLLVSGATVRAGVTNRLELEAKLPVVWRQDAYTNTIPNISNETTTETSTGSGLGDIELAGHYQINDGHEDWPFFIANLRWKTDTGTSPYDVPYNPDGTAGRLATGSGFNALEPSVTVIYPMDPAVLFGNIGYIHSFGGDVNRTIAGSQIGEVSPGDTYIASFGMGVALNDRLSFMLGYEHDYVRSTMTSINGVNTQSDELQEGSALTGFSLKINDNVHVNLNVAAGITRDAPDEEVILRVPVALHVFGD